MIYMTFLQSPPLVFNFWETENYLFLSFAIWNSKRSGIFYSVTILSREAAREAQPKERSHESQMSIGGAAH
jgi:hypothetical protein